MLEFLYNKIESVLFLNINLALAFNLDLIMSIGVIYSYVNRALKVWSYSSTFKDEYKY